MISRMTCFLRPVVLLTALTPLLRAAELKFAEADLKRVRHYYAAAPRIGLNANGQPMRVSGEPIKQGFGTAGHAAVYFELDGKAEFFETRYGIDDAMRKTGIVAIELYGDGKRIFESPEIKAEAGLVPIKVSLAGVHELTLVVQPRREFQAGLTVATQVDWVDPVIGYHGTEPKFIDPPKEEPYILTPKAPLKPRINGPKVVGARPQAPFRFMVPATGVRPMRFSAENLPDGLIIDESTGLIAGAPEKAGTFITRIRASNSEGVDVRELKVVVGRQLALTPPMGWNSWNCFAHQVTDEKIRAAAAALADSGLINHGWSYVNIDAYWMTRPDPDSDIFRVMRALGRNTRRSPFYIRGEPDPGRAGPALNSQGATNPNSYFPDMAGLVGFIHGLGLKAGIYSSPGPLTCDGSYASLGHEPEDVSQWKAWGFDYIKYDQCSYRVLMKDYASTDEQLRPYKLLGDELDAQAANMIFSVCQYGQGKPWEWAGNLGANLWRTTYDIRDSWSSMAGIGFSQAGLESFAAPGKWNDPDMLIVGSTGWGWGIKPSDLTPDEQYTHISLWALLSAPLLLGCDVTKLDDFTLNLLTNDEVIAIDQDSLGRQARRVSAVGISEIWAKPLEDGSLAVGLFNRSEIPETISVSWKDLGLVGPRAIHDVWRQVSLGVDPSGFSSLVSCHGVRLLKITTPTATTD